MPPFKDFIGGSYPTPSLTANPERTVNWYVERLESNGGTAEAVLYPTPGFQSFVTLPAVGGRALFFEPRGVGRLFAVVATSLIELYVDGTYTVRGAVAAGAIPATICSNGDGGDQLFITSGGHGYCYELTANTLTEVLTTGADQGGMLFGYFVAFDKATSTIRISDLFDGQTWDPTQFAQRTIGADPWVAMHITPYGQIALLGARTSEFWYNAGNVPFPFAPDLSGLLAQGSAAAFSVTQAGGAMVWLSTNVNGGYQVQAAKGYVPQRISTHAVESIWSTYARVDDAIGQTYEASGHAFYLLTFPSAGITWCYDFSTGLWHERGTWVSENNAYSYWRPVFHAFAWGRDLMADLASGVVYAMSAAYAYDIEGRVIRRLRRSPALYQEHKRFQIRRLEILMDVGLGNPVDPGADPQVMLRVSKDFGHTWGNERTASAGRQGQWWKRVYWLLLGQARSFVFEITVTDPIVNWRIVSCEVEMQPSTEMRAA